MLDTMFPNRIRRREPRGVDPQRTYYPEQDSHFRFHIGTPSRYIQATHSRRAVRAVHVCSGGRDTLISHIHPRHRTSSHPCPSSTTIAPTTGPQHLTITAALTTTAALSISISAHLSRLHHPDGPHLTALTYYH
jgi:hypothetical protein